MAEENENLDHDQSQRQSQHQEVQEGVGGDFICTTAVKGRPHYTNLQILADKQHYATLNSNHEFKIYNILSLECVEELDNIHPNDFEATWKKFDKFVYVPSWFTIDLRLGRPTICLEFSEYTNAWVYMENDAERKNLGICMAKIIQESLHYHNQNMNTGTGNNQNHQHVIPSYADLKNHSQVIKNIHVWFSSQTGKTLTMAPRWWENISENEKKLNSPPKAHFYLRDKKFEQDDIEKTEYDCLDLPEADKLSANNTCLIKKIAHHVHKTIEKHHQDISEEEAFRRYKITCNGQELVASNDLRTIANNIWSVSRSGIPIIYYERADGKKWPNM